MFGGTSLDYHRMKYVSYGRQRAQEKLTTIRARNDLEDMRRAICDRRKIKRADYFRRLDQWRYWRYLLKKARDAQSKKALRDQEAADYDQLLDAMADRRRKRAGAQEEAEFASILDEIRDEIPAPRTRLDETFRNVHNEDK